MGNGHSSAARTSRIPGIEGLRACAASAVLTVHVWLASGVSAMWLSLIVQPLNSGVTLFFTLSGFLLWRPFAAAALHGRPAPSLRRYARSRAFRILPAYWVVLAASALVMSSARRTPLTGTGTANGSITDPVLLAKDALLVQNLAPSTLSSGLVPAWSLAVEVAFYALLPLLGVLALWMARDAPRDRRVVAALAPPALLLAVGACAAVATAFLVPGPARVFANDWHSVLAWSFPNHAALFAFGMVVAVLRVEWEADRLRLPGWLLGVLDRVLLYAGVPFLIAGDFLLPAALYDPAIAFLCALLLARIALPPRHRRPAGIVRVLERRTLVAVGLASYSVFLWNFPIAAFLLQRGLLIEAGGAAAFAINLAIVAGVVGVLSAVTFLTVERPAMRFAHKGRQAARSSPGLAASRN